jgi:hypothetical protein
VEVADHRANADDPLARELDHEAEDAVRGRVVGAEVDLQYVPRGSNLFGHLEHGRDRRGNARPLVDQRALGDGHGRLLLS